MSEYPTSLKYIKRSTKRPEPGDVFAMQLGNEDYLFGRVILVEPDRATAPGPMCNLIYVYSARHASASPNLPTLTPNDLLIPPIWTNRKGWTKGLFRTVLNVPLERNDLLAVHCFRDPIARFGIHYRDEMGRALSGRVEPCGEWGLAHYGVVDREIREALGLKMVN